MQPSLALSLKSGLSLGRPTSPWEKREKKDKTGASSAARRAF